MTDYEAVIEIMESESTITSKVAKLQNGSTPSVYPAIVFGDLPKAQNVYPAISIRRMPKNTVGNIQTSFLIVDCWAGTLTASCELAQAVDDIFSDTMLTASAFAFLASSNILQPVSDGVCHNTPVSIKINYIRR